MARIFGARFGLNDGHKMIDLTVNGRSVRICSGNTILNALRAAGVNIPTLCCYPGMPARGVCRICLVEIRGVARPQPACTTLAHDGDVVETDSPALREFRKADAEWLLARHPNDCMACEVAGSCKFQDFVNEYQLHDRWEKVTRGPAGGSDHPGGHTSPGISLDFAKCIECGLCADACGEAGQQQYVIGFAGKGWDRVPVTVFDRPLADTPCISCGQCTLVCPTGALVETPHWHDVLHTLDARTHVSVVQVAPATRIAISEEFGMAPGTVSTGRMINALREIGFDYVFDTNFAADLTILEEASELLARLQSRERLPLFTSCCPGWVNWAEINRPDILPHLSSAKSPQQMHGALTKRGPFIRQLRSRLADAASEPYVVSVMPCTAKKDEAVRPGLTGDVDRVLTTRELARIFRRRDVRFHTLPEDGVFDSPLGESTGAGQMFAASGGVMEAIVRSTSHLAGKTRSAPLVWHGLRGLDSAVKTAHVPGVGKVAVCNGIAAAQKLLTADVWRHEFVAIEVMACFGGCLGGGGEPKSADPHALQKRMAATYDLDARARHRRSYQNAEVQRLYTDELGKPGSEKSRALLHTSYAGRSSARSLLMRFLDAVDRRDADAAADILHPEAVWKTSSAFGIARGAAEIGELIRFRLPARDHGARFARHRMEVAGDACDLTVVEPDGGRCRFELTTAALSVADQPRLVILELTRRPL